jgi:hypothetical protein
MIIGSKAWLQATEGNLSGQERTRLLSKIVWLRLKSRLRRTSVSRPCLNDLPVVLPDSKLVRLARDECRDCCSEAVYHHSCRTYFWAATLAKVDSIDFDAEELALASLLHDLELGKVENRSGTGCFCFAGAGAARASEWLLTHNVATDQRELISEAIALHLNPGVPLALGVTPHLLNIGAMADVVGTRMSSIAADDRNNVLDSHPRGTFKSDMKKNMQIEQNYAPKTRAGFLMSIGFAKLIDSAPFAE